LGERRATLAGMKAWRLTDTGGIGSYVLDDIDEPQPGPGEVRVKLNTVGLNHLDIWVSKGLPAPHSLPHIGGADGAGIVDAVGDQVTGVAVGDQVVIDPSTSCGACDYCRRGDIVYCSDFRIIGEHMPGTFTEKAAIPAVNAVAKPPDLAWDVAGSFGLASVTALRALEKARLKGGETVLVVGVGGGVSAAAMSFAKALGAAAVYVTSRSREKLDWAISQGADAAFDSTSEYGKEVRSLGGADVVFDNVGAATMRQSMAAAKPGGRIVIVGATSGPKMELTIPYLFFRQLELIGSSMGNHTQFARALDLIRLGEASSPVSRVFSFEELPDALTFLDSGDQLGKVAVTHRGAA